MDFFYSTLFWGKESEGGGGVYEMAVTCSSNRTRRQLRFFIIEFDIEFWCKESKGGGGV